jgi:hypothetical protein
MEVFEWLICRVVEMRLVDDDSEMIVIAEGMTSRWSEECNVL